MALAPQSQGRPSRLEELARIAVRRQLPAAIPTDLAMLPNHWTELHEYYTMATYDRTRLFWRVIGAYGSDSIGSRPGECAAYHILIEHFATHTNEDPLPPSPQRDLLHLQARIYQSLPGRRWVLYLRQYGPRIFMALVIYMDIGYNRDRPGRATKTPHFNWAMGLPLDRRLLY